MIHSAPLQVYVIYSHEFYDWGGDRGKLDFILPESRSLYATGALSKVPVEANHSERSPSGERREPSNINQ